MPPSVHIADGPIAPPIWSFDRTIGDPEKRQTVPDSPYATGMLGSMR
jgi:hypothetical protein